MGDFHFFKPKHECKSTARMEPSHLVQETWLLHVSCQVDFQQLELAPELWTKLRTSAPSSGAAAGQVAELPLGFSPVCPSLHGATGLAKLRLLPGWAQTHVSKGMNLCLCPMWNANGSQIRSCLSRFMHKTPWYVRVQSQNSKRNVFIFSVLLILNCSCPSRGKKKKKMEERESGKEMPHP